jgi:hypothetical protein
MEYDIDGGNTYLPRQAGFEPPLEGWEKAQELRPGTYAGYDHQFEVPDATADTRAVSFSIDPEWFL